MTVERSSAWTEGQNQTVLQPNHRVNVNPKDVVLATPSPIVEFRNVSKTFGDYTACKNISFHVAKGEFFSVLGPSGCGKTTTLRLIAGFEEPDANGGGEVLINGEVVNRKRPYERQLAMVFQNYALFPHLSIERNISFGLEMKKTPKTEIAGRVEKAMRMVQLDPGMYARRRPAQLSGGQRQRVALARALVLEPSVLLLDEPLGALDLKLRKEMQLELKHLNKQLGTTFIFVTHDQEEALTMSDRIAVMSNARVAQLGTPAEIYECPRTPFVARFIGETNFFEGKCASREAAGWVVEGEGSKYIVPRHPAVAEGKDVRIAVRPEWLDVLRPADVPADENSLLGRVLEVIYLGETLHVLVRVGEKTIAVAVRNEGQLTRPLSFKSGEAVAIAWKVDDCQVLEDD
jgi:spermidine/putrescine transport system ATP-binding protein